MEDLPEEQSRLRPLPRPLRWTWSCRREPARGGASSGPAPSLLVQLVELLTTITIVVGRLLGPAGR